MPAKKQIPKEAIIAAAFNILRKNGIEAVNARSIAKALNCSTQPIYLSFSSMNELKGMLLQEAENAYQQFIQRETAMAKYSPYKAYGMAYICFAKKEKQLFKFLFMRERTKEQMVDEKKYLTEVVKSISVNTGLDMETAYKFHSEMWFLGHGIATMLVTSYFELDTEIISEILTDAYQGLLLRYQQKG